MFASAINFIGPLVYWPSLLNEWSLFIICVVFLIFFQTAFDAMAIYVILLCTISLLNFKRNFWQCHVLYCMSRWPYIIKGNVIPWSFFFEDHIVVTWKGVLNLETHGASKSFMNSPKIKKSKSFTAECIDMEKFKRWSLLMILTILLKLSCKLCRIHHSYKRCWIGVTCTYPKTVFQETTVSKISCVNLKILVWIHSPLLVLCSLLLSAPIQFPHCDSNANSFCLKPFSRDSI